MVWDYKFPLQISSKIALVALVALVAMTGCTLPMVAMTGCTLPILRHKVLNCNTL